MWHSSNIIFRSKLEMSMYIQLRAEEQTRTSDGNQLEIDGEPMFCIDNSIVNIKIKEWDIKVTSEMLRTALVSR